MSLTRQRNHAGRFAPRNGAAQEGCNHILMTSQHVEPAELLPQRLLRAKATGKLSAAHAAAPQIWAFWRRLRGGSPEKKGGGR